MGLRKGKMSGVAITCLPFWYFWMVLAIFGELSSKTCEMPDSAALLAALKPPGPAPIIIISYCSSDTHRSLLTLLFLFKLKPLLSFSTGVQLNQDVLSQQHIAFQYYTARIPRRLGKKMAKILFGQLFLQHKRAFHYLLPQRLFL